MGTVNPMQVPPGRFRYTADHLWLGPHRDGCVVGVTGFAAAMLGDAVFVDIPRRGTRLSAGVAFAFVETAKTIVDLIAPISSVVVAGNGRLAAAPNLLNRDPYGEGWICLIESPSAEQLADLLSAAAYERELDGLTQGEDV